MFFDYKTEAQISAQNSWSNFWKKQSYKNYIADKIENTPFPMRKYSIF